MENKSLRQYYEQKAQELDEYHITYMHPSLYKRFFFNTRLKNVLSLLDTKKSERILDIGCGSGVYTKELLKRGAFVTATDIANNYLKQTKKFVGKNKKLVLIAADATKLPFPKNSFDKILFTEVIEHIPNYKKSLKEINRVLKKDGILVISTPSRFSPLNIAYNIKRIIKKYTFNEHVNEFTPKQFEKIVGAHFTIEKLEFSNYFFPYPIDQLVMNVKSKKFIKFLSAMEKFMQKNSITRYIGWTMIIRARK